MKIRTIFTIAILSIFALSYSLEANAAAAPQRSFSRTFKTGHNPHIAQSRSTTHVVDTFETETGVITPSRDGTPIEVMAGDSEELGVFGLTPKPWIKDRSMWKDPNGCTLIDGTPCTKPCGTKCMKPCDGGDCNKPKCVECEEEPKCVECEEEPKCVECEPQVVAAPAPIPMQEPVCANYMTIMEDELYKAIHYRCGDFAPVDLQYVDFRLQKGKRYGSYSDRMGKYRFRIFGCRREVRDVLLNQGRVVEKDMHFIDVFQSVTEGCLPMTKVPDDLCINPNQMLPEYILTAEITNFYMNVCDEFDWEKAKKQNSRKGSAEITVTWRLMDLTKTNVLWRGTSNGFSDIDEGEYNGELMLVERAFADAVDNLRHQPGFERQLATRVPPQELARQRQALIEMQRALDPVKCQYKETIKASTCDCCDQCPKSKCKEDKASQCSVEDETVWYEVHKEIKEEPVEFIDTVQPQKVVPAIEDSGSTSLGTLIIEEVTKEKSGVGFIVEEVSENVGVNSTCSMVDENGDFTSTGTCSEEEISEYVDIKSTCSIVDESGDFTSTGICPVEDIEEVEDYWLEVKQTDEFSNIIDQGVMCIKDREPYDSVTQEELLEIRNTLATVHNAKGAQAGGLILSEQYVLTSADIIIKNQNNYVVEIAGGEKINARAFRINPTKNTALLLLDKEIKYTPLSISLDLPEISDKTFISVGLQDNDLLENRGVVTGYRFSDNIGVEITTSTNTQKTALGSSLINMNGTHYGFNHSKQRAAEDQDMFLPMETALQSLGLEICEREFTPKRPKFTPVSDAIETNVGPKEPEAMKAKERK